MTCVSFWNNQYIIDDRYLHLNNVSRTSIILRKVDYLYLQYATCLIKHSIFFNYQKMFLLKISFFSFYIIIPIFCNVNNLELMFVFFLFSLSRHICIIKHRLSVAMYQNTKHIMLSFLQVRMKYMYVYIATKGLSSAFQ